MGRLHDSWGKLTAAVDIYLKYFLHVYKHIIKVLKEFLIHSHELSIKSTIYWDNPRRSANSKLRDTRNGQVTYVQNFKDDFWV